jgi:hypothetical protein
LTQEVTSDVLKLETRVQALVVSVKLPAEVTL